MRFKSSSSNRGSALEQLIEIINKQYENSGVALIDKTDPPVQIQQIKGNKITKGFLKSEGHLDFEGVMKSGRHIEFDTKEFKGNRFPLKNIKEKQYKRMKKLFLHGAVTFLLVNAVDYNEYFVLSFPLVKTLWEEWKENPGKKGYASVDIDTLRENAFIPKAENGYLLDYLKFFGRYAE